MARDKKVVSKRLGEVLVARGLVTEQQLNEALDIQKKEGGRIGEILVKLKYITEEAIAWALSIMYGYPYLPLENYSLEKSVATLVPADLAKKYQFIPVDRIGSVLTVAAVNPLTEEMIAEIEKATRCKIEIFVTTLSQINRAIAANYGGVS